MKNLFRTIKFAFSKNRRSDDQLIKELEAEVQQSDAQRGLGAMSSLVRGDYLLTRGKVFARDRTSNVIDV